MTLDYARLKLGEPCYQCGKIITAPLSHMCQKRDLKPSDATVQPCHCPETTGGPYGSPGPMCASPQHPGCRKRAERMALASTQSASATTLDMSVEARLKDAQDDVLRLHDEKMKFFERVIELERELETCRAVTTLCCNKKTTQSASATSEETEDSIGDWQCRDYADGWITFPTRKAAEKYQADTGAMMRYRRFYICAHRHRAKPMSTADEPVNYKLDSDNPSGMEWAVTVYPEPKGFSVTLSNTANQKRKPAPTGDKE